jgi:hypothetical protein
VDFGRSQGPTECQLVEDTRYLAGLLDGRDLGRPQLLWKLIKLRRDGRLQNTGADLNAHEARMNLPRLRLHNHCGRLNALDQGAVGDDNSSRGELCKQRIDDIERSSLSF